MQDDCISRQAVLDLCDSTDPEYKVVHFKEDVECLPPVQPEQKMGKWIIVDDCEQFIAKCSECGRIEDSRMISEYPYCHCGANMQEVEK